MTTEREFIATLVAAGATCDFRTWAALRELRIEQALTTWANLQAFTMETLQPDSLLAFSEWSFGGFDLDTAAELWRRFEDFRAWLFDRDLRHAVTAENGHTLNRLGAKIEEEQLA